MKIKNTKNVILKPILVGVIGLLAGIGLFIYNYFYIEDASIASYIISVLIMLVGLFGLISTLFVVYSQMTKLKVLKDGISLKAEYLSNNTKVKSSNVNYYFIEYKYILNNQEIIKRSSNEFIWKEVLTLKAVKYFNIKLYKNKIVLDSNLEKLFEDNKEAVKLEEQKYEDAYKTIDAIINQK